MEPHSTENCVHPPPSPRQPGVHTSAHACERIPKPESVARHDGRRLHPASGSRTMTSRSTSRSSGRATPGCGRHTTSSWPTRRCASRSSSVRSRASAPPDATAAGARPSSRPRSSGWPSERGPRRRGADAAPAARHRRRGGHDRRARRASTATSTRAATSPWRATRPSSSACARRSPTSRPGASAEDHRLLDAHEVGRVRPGRATSLGGSWTPHCAAIHPARLVRGLAGRSSGAGSRLRATRPSTWAAGRRHPARHGPRRARRPRHRGLHPDASRAPARAIAPIYSLMIATEPLSDDVLGRSASGAADLRRQPAPRRLRPAHGDGRIAFGGRGAPYHYASRVRRPSSGRPRARDAAPHPRGLFPVLRDATSRTRGAATSACRVTGSRRCATTSTPGWPSPAATSVTGWRRPPSRAARWPP